MFKLYDIFIYLFACFYGVCACGWGRVRVLKGQREMLDIMIHHTPPCSLRTKFVIKLRVSFLSSKLHWSSHPCLPKPCSAFGMGAADLNSGLCLYRKYSYPLSHLLSLSMMLLITRAIESLSLNFPMSNKYLKQYNFAYSHLPTCTYHA